MDRTQETGKLKIPLSVDLPRALHYMEKEMHITYHVGPHDGGYAYRLDDVWSEPFATHDLALAAANVAAKRQQVAGRATEIMYQSQDGRWHSEHSRGGDRPEADVLDG